MNNTTQDELYKTFVAVSGRQASNLDEIANSLAGVVAEINKVQLQPGQTVQAQAAKSAPAASGGGGGGSVASTVESVATTVLKSGFGIVPLVSELFGLFGGGGDSAPPPPLVKYAMPAKANFAAAETQSGLSNIDYDQTGMPRAYMAAPATGTGAQSGAGPAPQITVNVQAMDARSFLDRSSDIALAVRDAMLNLNAINDVVNEL